MKPCDVKPSTPLNVYNVSKISVRKKILKIGDIVRISKYKGAFSKGFEINWSPELFKIVKININNPPTFLLEDMNGHPIKGCFYQQELQKTKLPDVYLVEKIIRKRRKNGVKQALVRWLGFPKPTWVNEADVIL